ncbi:hypothetical protein [Streptomyces sp. NPDC006195]|uniref:hypothetical protein n=1 Tax=unclassified Streptomyces TaxID=2593676 RepID=UPI0033BD6F1D
MDSSTEDGRIGETARHVSALDVVSLPWVFTQHHPLDSKDFIRQAKDRGVNLDERKLRELYRQGLLIPIVAVTSRRKTEPRFMEEPEPQRAGTLLYELRTARERGRLLDLKTEPFLPRLHFTPPKPNQPHWWNGLIYSQHQLAVLPKIDPLLAKFRYSHRNRESYPRLPEPNSFLKYWASWYHRVALMATALEARYLPVLDSEWVHLVNADFEAYDRYRRDFDPRVMSEHLTYPVEQVRKDAEELLLLAHSIDPMGGRWSQLLRRAPRNKWKDLKGAARSAMDLRETAEILLRFYEDLAERGHAQPLPVIPEYAWHPLHERLSTKNETLDQDLMHLGLSPHPRVIFAVEGESEALHVPLIWRKLGYPESPELVRLLKLGGTSKDLAKIAGLAATPLVTQKAPGGKYWQVTRPPTRFMVVADPENDYSATRIDRTRELMLEEIRSGLAVQGAGTSETELNELIEIRTWDESCYEFAHFSDEELADGISQVHNTCNGWTRDELISALAYRRGRNEDIKQVWEGGRRDDTRKGAAEKWSCKVSKNKLAEVLWPVLEQKIDANKLDSKAPFPPMVQAVVDAFVTAQNWRYKSFVLTAVD